MISTEMCVESASSMETSECNAKRGEQGTTTVSYNRIPKLGLSRGQQSQRSCWEEREENAATKPEKKEKDKEQGGRGVKVFPEKQDFE